MDRLNLDLKELKKKGFSSERIVLLTDIALNDNITNNEYTLFCESKVDDKYLKNIYHLILSIKEKDKDHKYSILSILQFLFSLDSDYLNTILNYYNNSYLTEKVIILNNYFKPEYGKNGINLITYLYESKYLIKDNSWTSEPDEYISFDDKEIESIYSNTVKYYTNSECINYLSSRLDKLEKLLYYLKLKLYKDDKVHYSLKDEEIKFIDKLIFESDKYDKESYINSCEFLIDKLYDNISIDILSNYINTDKSRSILEDSIKKDLSDYADIDSLLPVDKMIRLLRSIPDNNIDSEYFKYIFRMRRIDSEKLKILLTDNISTERISYFYTITFRIHSSWDPNCKNPTEKINAMDMDVFKNFFDSRFLDSDIKVLDDFGSILGDYKNDFNQKYYDFIFKHIKNLLPEKADSEDKLHFCIIRFMKILLYVGNTYCKTDDTNKVEGIISLLSEIFNTKSKSLSTKSFTNQRLDNLNEKCFEDCFYNIYKELILFIINLHLFEIPTSKIKKIYNSINKDIVNSKLEYEYNYKPNINYNIKFLKDSIRYIKSYDPMSSYNNRYTDEDIKFIKDNFDFESLKESYSFYIKLPSVIYTDFSIMDKPKPFIDIFLCKLANIEDEVINKEIKRLQRHKTNSKKDYYLYDILKEEKFYDFYKSKIEEVKE